MASEGVAPLDERIGKTVRQLRELTQGAPLQFALMVGRIVVDTLYDGDARAWRSRARKDHALRALAARPDLPMSASALYRALAIYELSRRQSGGDGWQHVGVSHLRAVLGLAEDAQTELLARAEAEQWTAARLERESAAFRGGARPAGGRKRVPGYVKSIRRIFELTSAPALDGLESVCELNAEERAELTGMLESARGQIELLQRRLLESRTERPRAVAEQAPAFDVRSAQPLRSTWSSSESDAAE